MIILKICMHGLEISPSKEGVIAGGLPTSVVRLTKALKVIGIDSTIVTNDRKFREVGIESTDFMLPWADVELIFIRSKYANIRYSFDYLIKCINKMYQISENGKFDIIHGHSGFPEVAVVTEEASRRAGVPAVHTIYSPVMGYRPYLLKFYIKKIKKIIAVSKNVKRTLIRSGFSSDKIEVIPTIVDFSIFKPDGNNRKSLRDALGIGEEFTMLYLGNLTKTKEIDTVLDAMNLVRNKFENIKLLSGLEKSCSGNDSRAIEIQEKKNSFKLNANIIEMGMMHHVEKVMNAVDLVVAPFRDTYGVADYPVVVLESMAVGTPVITTCVGGNTEIIKNNENGILINPGDSIALAHEIIELIKDPKRCEEMGEKAAAFMQTNFSEEKIVNETKRVYEESI